MQGPVEVQLGSDLENCPSTAAPKPWFHPALRTVWLLLTRPHILWSHMGRYAPGNAVAHMYFIFHVFSMWSPLGGWGVTICISLQILQRQQQAGSGWKKWDVKRPPLRPPTGVSSSPAPWPIFVSACPRPSQPWASANFWQPQPQRTGGRNLGWMPLTCSQPLVTFG